jgi:DNA-binding NarL/FixJ family response regulator
VIHRRIYIDVAGESKEELGGDGSGGQELHQSRYMRRSPQPSPSSLSTRGDELTKREREVVRLLAEGKSNKEIAPLLNISVKTVETYRARVMGKLNLHSVAHLVRYAVQNKLVVF